MDSEWTVLGGWGVDPGMLQPVFGREARFVDSNRLMPLLVDHLPEVALRVDWRQRCADALALHGSPPRYLAGWSTGAIIALGCAALLDVRRLVLMSAAPAFCRFPGFTSGAHPRLLRAMRDRLTKNPCAVLRDFLDRCGFSSCTPAPLRWTQEELTDGLYALEFIRLDDLPPLPCMPLCIHGISDSIIPLAAGEWIFRKYGGTLIRLEAPHACFIDNNEAAVRSAIHEYMKGQTR